MNNFTQGDRVFHPNQKAWGIGKVTATTPDNIDVFFVGVGAKRLAKSLAKLELAEGSAAKHPLLDNLIEASQLGTAGYVSVPSAIERFQSIYPDGLEGKAFLQAARGDLVRGHQFCVQLLGQEELAELIAEGRYQDVCDRARHVESVTNLLTKSEKTALYKALEQTENQRLFSVGLANLLYGAETEEDRFKRFLRVLNHLDIEKWPFATFFGFVRFPQERAFIKPTAIQNAAKALCWRIGYKAEPNWKTYNSVLRLYNHIRTSLVEEGMMPRDLIDVQAFIWSVAQK
jgi:hypothetical protein